MTLLLLPGAYAVCRLSGGDEVPGWARSGDFFSVTRTSREFSVVCAEETVPQDIVAERGWRCLFVQGTLDFSVTGVVSSLAVPLAAQEIGIFVISTYDTDYLLVRSHDLDRACSILRDEGHEVDITDGAWHR